LSGVQGLDTQDHVLPTIQSQFSVINPSFISVKPTTNQYRQFRLSHDESFRVDDFDLNLNSTFDLNVSQAKTQEEVPVSEVPNDHVVNGSYTYVDVELAVDVVRIEEHVVEQVRVDEVVDGSGEEVVVHGIGEKAVKYGNGHEVVEETSGKQVEYDVDGIDSADVGIDDDDDDEEDDDFLVDEENEIVKLDVDVHMFGISKDVPFENIGVTSLVPEDILEGEDVDVVNANGIDSNTCYVDETSTYMRRRLNELIRDMEESLNARGRWKYSFYIGQIFGSLKEAKDRVYMHSIESRKKWRLYKNDRTRVRERCKEILLVFTMSQRSGPIGPKQAMGAGPNKLSGLCTRSKKRKTVEQIFNQIRVNSDIPVKAVQDQLQRYLDIQVSMSKTFRAKAKAKAEREVKGDHTLEYDMLKYYVVELQSTNPNTTIKIVVERNIDPSLPTSVFKIIYVCLRALKMGFMACRRELLGLDGAFMKGLFSSQVLAAIGLDSKNGIYPLAYALVEAKNAFIPYKKSKAGKLFAFVWFIKVDNIDRLVTNLCTIWIGCFHLHANVARFHRETKPSAPSHTSNANKRNSPGSYVSILKPSKTSNVMSDQSSDDEEDVEDDGSQSGDKVTSDNDVERVSESSCMHNNDLLYDKDNNIIPDKDKVLSEDPFNLYDTLNKRKDNGDDLKYPPGFTPSVINVEEVNKKVKGATSKEVNEHVNSTSNKLEKSVPKGKLSSNNSVCSKRVHTGGSILQFMDELV
ncbi:heat stress transcription factor B-4-like protein, partial [Tanacetum coccineum]